MHNATIKKELLLAPLVGVALLLTPMAYAAAPGITGPAFNLTAQQAYLNQPDGEAVYSWGYGCSGTPAGFAPTITGQICPTMQVPGPTLIVTEGASVTVQLTNNLPTAAGNTSILFPGFNVTATGGVTGLLTQEAAPGGTVTYTFTASAPGTHPYYSGTQGDLQIEMGLYGAVIVLPASVPANCNTGYHAQNLIAEGAHGEADFRLAHAAYDHPGSCYDREYLFQWAEMDSRIHHQAEAQVAATVASGVCATAGNPACSLTVQTEPYHPAYFLINGRSMPDLMDPNFASEYPHQPYNANPHMHPGELTLVRTIGQGRWQHPFHEHANHVRILSRDGNLILSSSTTPISYNTPGGTAASGPGLAGVLMFNTDTTPGESFDGIFYFTGRGLNWDPYGHHPGDTADPLASLTCTPDANGYNSSVPTAINFMEWCQDHNKPVQVAPFGDVPGGGPVTLPDPNVFTNGQWYGGTPYLGPDASLRASMKTCVGNPYGTANPANATCTTLNPANTQLNPANERGWAFMWHSHNEREITTNNVFPGGMLMMMLVDSREFQIDESN
ncbi:MAG: multicopper oxidase domain-containing protein [Acidobacteria bacterium Pan2503]|uniref:Multicopper oxidase domain-containing protein n=1 Tax=Candidatus Acidiferrum panamense TaxID=2741543 RepID=A0A7V8NNJ2_9BACT|nr:multicopper oxidase domain-containing protein [Candidatus Acidoferrum panamensis]